MQVYGNILVSTAIRGRSLVGDIPSGNACRILERKAGSRCCRHLLWRESAG
jgi:hypothetical protein